MNKQITAAKAVKPAAPAKAASIEEIPESPMTPEEVAALDGEKSDLTEAMRDATHQVPDWAMVPPGLKYPPNGVGMVFLRIPAAITMTPTLGDRQCILWPLNETEEIFAHERSRGSRARSMYELSKGCIRVVDGQEVDWAKGAANVLTFWRDIGGKGRALIMNYYAKQHMVDEEEAIDFFSKHCVAVTVQRG